MPEIFRVRWSNPGAPVKITGGQAMRMADMICDERHKITFDKLGFVVIPGFFPGETVRAVSDWLDALQQQPPGPAPEARYFERSSITGEPLLVRVEYILGDHNPEITRLLLTNDVSASLTTLLGEPPVLFKEKVNYKVPGSRPDKLHQDQAAGWNAYTNFFVTLCIVIDENRRDNAALSFLGNGKFPRALMGPEWKPLTDQDPPYQPEEDYTLVVAQPGDAIFFNSYIPHGSPANRSNACRRNIYLTFNGRSAGDHRDRYYQDKWRTYPPNRLEEARAETSYRV